MNHQTRPPGTIQIVVIRLRRAIGQTRPGRALKRLLGREIRIPVGTEPDPSALAAYPGDAELPPEVRDDRIAAEALAWRRKAGRQPRRTPSRRRTNGPGGTAREGAPIVNVILASHCDFTGNSALHVLAIASELHRRGLSPVVAVPDRAETVEDVGRPPFPVLTYAEVSTDALRFPDGRGPDLVHAFTPRELVRELTVELVRAHGCRYLVHLEDDDEVVMSAELGGVDMAALRELPLPMLDRIVQPRQSHPLRGARFLEEAAGITVLIDSLLELVPEGVPAAVVRAGFDEAVLSPRRPRDELRAELELEPEDLAIAYTGNVHSVNREEMRSLYAAVAQLRREGQRAVLVKTGWGSGVAATFPSLGAGLRDLGWISRDSVWDVLAAADVLVQPGGPSPFNDFRFPSKLPEYLASGRPVVLPRTNVGLELRDGEEALLLERGDAAEIAAAVTRLAADPALRARLGEAGRAFALRELRWSPSVDKLEALLREIAGSGRPPAPAWLLEGADPPVELVAFVPEAPTGEELRLARAHGIHGFRLDAGEPGLPIEAPPSPGQAYGEAMRERLAAPLPDRPLVRSLAFPGDPADVPLYEAWLRKLVLQAAICAPGQEPLVYLDAARAWLQPAEREAFLAATRSGLRDGIAQLYASRHLAVSREEADLIVRVT